MSNEACRVLIVEDEPDINNLLAEILAVYGLEAIQAFTGEDALRLVEKYRPEAILLDLMLPGMSGFSVCRRLKTARPTCGTAVVIVTALDQPSDRIEAYESGADDYVTKPFNPEGLAARVRAAVARCREAARPEPGRALEADLSASAEGLKALGAIGTALYLQTELSGREIEALRGALVKLAQEADAWAARHRGALVARVRLGLKVDRMRLEFGAADPTGEEFLAEHLDRDAIVPSELVDAGAIDTLAREGTTVVMEKALPPRGQGE
jgi:DNA-binding response OmpR family regulator